MPERHLVITPLPNGIQAGVGRLSALLSPRLREDGELGDYTDFRDWAGNVAGPPGLNFQVLIDGVALLPAAVTIVSPPPDQAVWRALFGPPASSLTPVRRATFVDRGVAVFTTMDSAALARMASDLYAAVAALGGAVDRDTLASLTDPALATVLAEAQTFMDPVGNGAAPVAKEQEFHAVLRQLQAHPRLLRLLGLAVDFQVVLPATFTEVQVRTNWAAATGAAPRDEIQLRMRVDTNFEPVVSEPDYRKSRWLTFGGDRYEVAQLSSLNTTAGLEQLQRSAAAAGTGDAVLLPALEDGGLSIITEEQAARIARAIDRQRVIEDGIDDYITGAVAQPPLLVAEDVAAGARIDVEDVAAPTFRSLHRRQTDGYHLPRNPALAVTSPPDEGWSSTAVFTDGAAVFTPKNSPVRYGEAAIRKSEEADTTHWRLDDHLLTWSGWSLSAPRPGRVIDGNGNVIDRPANEPLPTDEARLAVDYVVQPGTLPLLRYAHTYRFQGRTVDLAGNSPASSDLPPSTAISPEITYGRTRPVSPPEVVRRASRPDPGVGDTADVLVIRSELNQPNITVDPTHRLFFPPPISQHQLEQHDLPNGGIDPASYAMLAARDAVTLADQCLVDPETGELVAGAGILAGQVTPGPAAPDVEYLADPAGRAVAFSGLPGSTDVVSVEYGPWPTFQAPMLTLRAGPTDAPVVDATDLSVTVRLPKSGVATVDVSSAIDADLLAHFRWFQALAPADQAAQLDAIVSGRSQVFGPSRRIQLVHAVRLPLEPPSFTPDAVSASRDEVGQTTALLAGTVNDHGGSTEHLTIRARWVDPVDDVSAPTPGTATRRAVVGDVSARGTGTDALDGLIIELGDAKRHLVEIDAEAFCRFSRFFTERLDALAVLDTPVVLSAQGLAASSVTVENPINDRRYVEGVDYSVDAAAGTITGLSTGAIAAGSPVRVEFIPLPVSRRSEESPTGATTTFTVPASARPAPPQVAHILPAFARTVTASANLITIDHDGRVLRVFLERPWFSSGLGELLGVAIEPAGVADRVLTRWGRDAITPGPGATIDPTTSTFTARSATAALVDGRFDVAAHAVRFDTDRGLWTSDVAIDATFGYRPFVQLALCRYQPEAIAGEHVSDTVSPDALRLGARRIVRVAQAAGGRAVIRVTGPDNVNQMRVTLQVADPAIDDPELRWVSVGAPLVLNRTGTRAASVHRRVATLPQVAVPRRLLLEDREPVRRQTGNTLVNDWVVAYREVIDVPAGW